MVTGHRDLMNLLQSAQSTRGKMICDSSPGRKNPPRKVRRGGREIQYHFGERHKHRRRDRRNEDLEPEGSRDTRPRQEETAAISLRSLR